MKKAGLYFILSFIIYLIGNLLWLATIVIDKPLLSSNYLDMLMLVIIFTFFAILGLIGAISLYKSQI